MRVGIIGMGYVGLPLAIAFTNAGHEVTGFDLDEFKIMELNQKRSYISHIPSERIPKGGFSATNDFSRLAEMEAIVICVPTPLGKSRTPDLSAVEATCETIGTYLQKDQLVVLESTTYPGTTREVMLPILEKKSGLKAGVDFHLAYSPERENPGDPKFTTNSIPKVVGALTNGSLNKAIMLYTPITELHLAESLEVAEASKILENTYRAVNIALVNELKYVFDRMGIDTYAVIRAAKTKPFGFQAFYPGPGLGGHCIPIDPFYLSWKARQFNADAKFIELAGEVNREATERVIVDIADKLNDDVKSINCAKILIIGVAYKPGVEDVRESPAIEIIDQLVDKNAEVKYHDPYVATLPELRHYKTIELNSVPLTREEIMDADLVVIITNHDNIDYKLIDDWAKNILDTRNSYKWRDR